MSICKLILSIGLAAAGLVQALEPRSDDAVKTSGPIKLDGVISESAWKKVPWQGDFTRLDGKPAVEPTRFKVLAGERGLFFAIEATDSSIKDEKKNHDGPIWFDDCMEIFILPEPEPAADSNIREYKHFMFNPSGVRFEQAVKGGVGNPVWNVPWKTASVKTAKGFNAEVFIPYYALAPFSGAKTWRFNIGRENRGKVSELSIWSPSNKFQDAEKFGILKNIPADLSAYTVSFFSSDIQMKSLNGKILPSVGGILNGSDKVNYTVQIAARTPDGKLAAFNSVNATPLGGKAAVSIPLEIAESGKYLLTASVIGPKGRTLAYEEKTVTVRIASFEVKMIEPHYRNNIYLALPEPKLIVNVTQFSTLEEYKNAVLTVTVSDSSGKTVAEKRIKAPSKMEKVEFGADRFTPGAFKVRSALSGAGKNDGDFTLDFNVIAKPAKGNLITLDPERRVLLNGKPFFPSGFYGYSALPALRKAGFNILIHSHLNQADIDQILKKLDEVHRYGLMLAFPPRYKIRGDFFGFTENGKKVRTLSAGSYKKIETMVNAVKTHPAFFGWYLYDEPRGAEMTAELKRQYEFLRKTDPDHPVLGGDNTAGACIAKQGSCDIHVLDLYYCPRFNGKPDVPLASILAAVQNVRDTALHEAVWYMPQSFNHGSFYKQRFPSPTYAESRVMVFGAVAAGATGMVPYKIGQENCRYFERHANSGIFFSPEMKLGWLEGLGPEIRNLSPVLLSGKIPIRCSSGKIWAAGRKLNGRNFVIAVNPQTSAVDAEIVWPDSRTETLRVLGEKRSVALKNGKIVKTFAPYAVHVYTDDSQYPEGVDIAAVTDKIAKELKTVKGK